MTIPEKEAVEIGQIILDGYQKIGPDTRRTMADTLPAWLHLFALNGYELTRKQDDA